MVWKPLSQTRNTAGAREEGKLSLGHRPKALMAASAEETGAISTRAVAEGPRERRSPVITKDFKKEQQERLEVNRERCFLRRYAQGGQRR